MSFTRLEKVIIVAAWTAAFVMYGVPYWEVF